MTNAEIKSLFFASWDAYVSGIIDDNTLNDHFTKAAMVSLKKLFNQMGLDNQYDTELDPLLKSETISTSASTIDFHSQLTDPFERLVNLQITYNVSGKIYTDKAAQPLNDNEILSPYSQGTYRYPRFVYVSALSNSASANNSSVVLIPSTNITAKKVRYFREYFPFDFGNNTFESANSPYGTKTIQMIVDNALLIAANAYREDGFFQTQGAIENKDNINV